MKTTLSKILIVLLVLSSVLTIAASPNNHKIKITSFTGEEVFTGFIDPGTVKFVDGKVIVKGMVITDTDAMSDPRVSGNLTTTVNFVYDLPADPERPYVEGTGPVWGTIQLSNASGTWNIRFSGYQYGGCKTIIHGQGWGEGEYKGLIGVWKYQSNDCMMTAAVNGYIIDYE